MQDHLRARNRRAGGILDDTANASKCRLGKALACTQKHGKDCKRNSYHSKPPCRHIAPRNPGAAFSHFLNVKKPMPRLLGPQEGNRETVEFFR